MLFSVRPDRSMDRDGEIRELAEHFRQAPAIFLVCVDGHLDWMAPLDEPSWRWRDRRPDPSTSDQPDRR
ncbi:hypothetical protein V6U90_13005 [Micromonospora sp. CPCC 206060]|uniref:hypothetical protein n=1 Tax=Micromonospora sp. CPCC 206060 TaxID=3122406 RepID=UPI002FF3D5BB